MGQGALVCHGGLGKHGKATSSGHAGPLSAAGLLKSGLAFGLEHCLLGPLRALGDRPESGGAEVGGTHTEMPHIHCIPEDERRRLRGRLYNPRPGLCHPGQAATRNFCVTQLPYL